MMIAGQTAMNEFHSRSIVRLTCLTQRRLPIGSGSMQGKKGDKTHQWEFRDPLLKTLLRHQVGVARLQALKELEREMVSQLSAFDKSDIRSGTLRWQKSAEWEVNKMRNEGLMEPVAKSGAGLWKLTFAGQRAAMQKRA